MEAEVRERLAVLEAAHGALTENQESILAELKEIRSELTRYRGFVGGVSFVVSGDRRARAVQRLAVRKARWGSCARPGAGKPDMVR